VTLLLVLATVGAQSWTHFSDDDDDNAGGSFEHLLVDWRTGRLYVSATNRLYQLDARLTVEATVTTGPQADNPLCPPPPTAECHDATRVPTDAVSKALALDERDERLIVCTNLFQVLTATTLLAPVKAEFHYTSWFGAGSELASVMEFGREPASSC